jgi:hypothetical protein
MQNDLILVQEEPRGPSQLVEIPVTAATQRVQLPDVQQLRSMVGQTIIIKAIRLITDKVLVGGMTIQAPTATLDELKKICLVLYSEGWEKGQMIPILSLNDMADFDSSGTPVIPYRNKTTRFNNWRNVDWAQSYLLYANGNPADNLPYVVMLDVEYIKLDGQGKPIIGPS